ncbi:MAG: F0F1 ATP synthase subunit A, partial [Patescibacteria group bacterium]
ISLSFRLFGNIFAGEVLLTVMAFLVPYIIPLPFLALEVFVGFIQALVFAMLTLVFLKMGMEEAHH